MTCVATTGLGMELLQQSLFSSSAWLKAVAGTYGFAIEASTCLDSSGNDAGLMFVHVNDIRGERIVSFPFSDYCDPLAEDLAAWRDLVAPLLERRVPISFRCLRNSVPAADARFEAAGRWLWHGLDLARSETELWQGLARTARQSIRRGIRSGLTVRETSLLDDIRIFYSMHCHVRKRKYRLLPQPFAFFEQLHAAFAPAGCLSVLIAEHDGLPVAGTFFIRWNGTLYYKFNASVDQRYAPNDLLVWEGIKLGLREGLHFLDFGASDLDQPGLLQFKRKYASEEREIVRYRWTPPGYEDLRGQQVDHMLAAVTNLLTDPLVSDTVTQAGGNTLYGLFC